MMLLHVDTDLGGDPDDACALAMLAGWSDITLTAITTTTDPDGRRAGCVHQILEMLGRNDIAVFAGAAASWTTGIIAEPFDRDIRYWPNPVPPRPSAAGAAVDALERSIDRGARVVCIGPLTNLAILECLRPGILATAHITVMGGWVDPPGPGMPPFKPEDDWNIQWDTNASRTVFRTAGSLTLATLPGTLMAPVTKAVIPPLLAMGSLGKLLARQILARADDARMVERGGTYAGVPDDLLNFHYDPVACALAAGRDSTTLESDRLSVRMDGSVLRFDRDPGGRLVNVVTAVDGPAFSATWLDAVRMAARASTE